MSTYKLNGSTRYLAMLAIGFASMVLFASGSVAAEPATDDTVVQCQPVLIEATDKSKNIQGTDCPDLIVADSDTESIDSGEGDDIVIGGAHVLTLDGGSEDDIVYSNGSAEASGGADDDLIYGDGVPDYGAPDSAASEDLRNQLAPFTDALGEQTVEAALEGAEPGPKTGVRKATPDPEPTQGNDNLFGGQGDDTIFGLAGNDRIFGNIGDDDLHGNSGDDLVSGGHGGDAINGGGDSDMVRGDGTTDYLRDTGPSGTDTLSFASGVTPGFTHSMPYYINFPPPSGERGVYVDLQNQIADNGKAEDGGGREGTTRYADNLTGFENIIGTPYADYIVGNSPDPANGISGVNVIDGGGGTDVILGMGGVDVIFGEAGHDNLNGGAGNDYIDGGPGNDFCQEGQLGQPNCNEAWTGPGHVIPRDASKIAVGAMTRPGIDHKDFYMTGSTGVDDVEMIYTHNTGSADTVKFKLTTGSFDTSQSEKTKENCDYTHANSSPKRVICESNDRIGTIMMAGVGGNDDLFGPDSGMPRATTYMALGGYGNDYIKGSTTSDDLLVDGPGKDTLLGYEFDDGIINNTGVDTVWLGQGDDLVLSTSLCGSNSDGGSGGGDKLHGQGDQDTASWSKLDEAESGVAARIYSGVYGRKSASGPSCAGAGGYLGSLDGIERLEGSNVDDVLFGDGIKNTLLGRSGDDVMKSLGGPDTITGEEGEDSVEGGDGDDKLYMRDNEDDTIDCGAGSDRGEADEIPDDSLSNCDGGVIRGIP